MVGAHSSEYRWMIGLPRFWNDNFATVSAALVDPESGGQTTSNESRGAAGNKRHRIVEFGTPYNRPISSCGLLLVEMMMIEDYER
ncbi:jg16803 [Pararge aegeria aegeria]|uniref:Jg16803 protein n=1 Tax=Pararge aegeria aegeria TaxID=348720 RepID=A0A8S4R0Q0_9NEOP|nr:jg16803 [Pararge aegeria aegeria]